MLRWIVIFGVLVGMVSMLAVGYGTITNTNILEFASARQDNLPRLYLLDVQRPRLIMPVTEERYVPSAGRFCPTTNQYLGVQAYENYPFLIEYQGIFPVISPDGTQVILESPLDGNFDIYLLALDTRELTNLTDNSLYNICPVWSPNGDAVLYMQRAENDFDIMRIDITTGDISNLTAYAGTDSEYAWSPDGTQITFTSSRDGDGNVYVMNADGSGLRQLTHNPANDFAPVWSPDGTQIAFVSVRDGNAEIYVVPADGSEYRRLTVHTSSDYAPRWLK